jgi:hypothetical protein
MVLGVLFEVAVWVTFGAFGLIRLRALPGPSWALIAASLFGVALALLGPAFSLGADIASGILPNFAGLFLVAALLVHGLLSWFPYALVFVALWRLMAAAYASVPYDEEPAGE